MPGWIGRDERKPVVLAGTVFLRGGRSIPITVVDFSRDGCRVECEETLPIAMNVRLEVGEAVANAHVRWALPGAAGLQLL